MLPDGQTYVVTGAAGFIGSHLAARLLQDGHTVRAVDNLLTGRQENLDYLSSLDGDLHIHHIDITDKTALLPVLNGADVVFHHAALPSVPLSLDNPFDTHHHCATGTLRVLEAAHRAGVRRVIYAGSSSAYGETENPFETEDVLPAPLSPYGAAKLAGEHYCQAFYESFGLETVVLRYFNVFGARQDPRSQYAAVIPKFITLMLRGKQPVIYGSGEQTRDFTYIDNIVHGNLLAARVPEAAGQTMNLATGEAISVNALVDALNDVLGTDIEAVHEAARPGDILHSAASIERAENLLGFSPVVDFTDGLRQTVDWYRQTL
jgi:UDP-glucose 4-epimerase